MKKENSSRRKEKGAETRRTLYQCAETLFNEYGADEVSIDAIVEAAGVSKGTFYVHFESKDALLLSLIADYADRVDMDYEAFLKSLPPETPAPDILLLLVGRIFDVIEHTITYRNIRTLYRVQIGGLAQTQTATSYTRALYQMLGNVVDEGIRRGEFKASLPVDALTRHLIVAMRGITYEWCVRYPDYNLKEQALAHFQLLLEGLRAASN